MNATKKINYIIESFKYFVRIAKVKKFLILLLLVPSLSWGQGYKAFVCNYYASNAIAGKQCDGTNSFWKIYFDTSPYSTKEICTSKSEESLNASKLFDDMFPEVHPDYGTWWIIGCDENWN